MLGPCEGLSSGQDGSAPPTPTHKATLSPGAEPPAHGPPPPPRSLGRGVVCVRPWATLQGTRGLGVGMGSRPGWLASLLRTCGRLSASTPHPCILGYVCGHSPLLVPRFSCSKPRAGVLGASCWWGCPLGTVSKLCLQPFPASLGETEGSQAPISEPLCSWVSEVTGKSACVRCIRCSFPC